MKMNRWRGLPGILAIIWATSLSLSTAHGGQPDHKPTGSTDKATLEKIVATGISRLNEGVDTQESIDELHGQNKSLQADYQHLLKITDGIQVYNQVLEAQISQQQQELAELLGAIEDAAAMERRIIPLLSDMVTTLEKFIEADVPFLVTERRFRVLELKKLITRADISTAEKMRRVLQAYQIEGDYGRTIEAYRDQIELDGDIIAVEFLRVGRVGLMYQTLDGSNSGAWNSELSKWEPISGFAFKQNLTLGLKMAKKQMAPTMLFTPIFSLSSVE